MVHKEVAGINSKKQVHILLCSLLSRFQLVAPITFFLSKQIKMHLPLKTKRKHAALILSKHKIYK